MPRQQPGLLVAASLLLFLSPLSHASTLLRGENRTCRDFADLDFALDHPTGLYFKNWESKDFDAAQSWVDSCSASPPTNADRERAALLAARRATLEAHGDVQRTDKVMNDMRQTDLDDENARRAELAKSDAERKLLQEKYEACLRSRAYRRYTAQLHAVEALDRLSQAKQALEYEKRVEDASDTTNLYAKRRAGESLVAAQDDMNKWWTAYRGSGGEEQNPQSIPRVADNPCNPAR